MKDYQKSTLQAYDDGVDKYQASASEMVNLAEINKLISFAPHKYKAVLDVGCAFGKETAVFNSKGWEAIGIDFSREFIKRAKKLHPTLKFKHMDMLELQFKPESFSAVWSNAVLHHLKDEDVIKALKEFHRVLKPEGVFGVSFKKGEGSEEIVESFSSNGKRFYKYQTEENIKQLLGLEDFKLLDMYVLNERKNFGPQYRDLDWLWVFARKA